MWPEDRLFSAAKTNTFKLPLNEDWKLEIYRAYFSAGRWP